MYIQGVAPVNKISNNLPRQQEQGKAQDKQKKKQNFKDLFDAINNKEEK